jgi:hypothetical protein
MRTQTTGPLLHAAPAVAVVATRSSPPRGGPAGLFNGSGSGSGLSGRARSPSADGGTWLTRTGIATAAASPPAPMPAAARRSPSAASAVDGSAAVSPLRAALPGGQRPGLYGPDGVTSGGGGAAAAAPSFAHLARRPSPRHDA